MGRDAPQQSVNQAARKLESAGHIKRPRRADGRIGNYPSGGTEAVPALPAKPQPSGFLSEDDAKRFLTAWLEAAGWKVDVAWGGEHGIDMDARRGDSRWIIEVKGQGSRPEMRVNYFLGVLGETLQRMNDPQARYSIALPDLPQFRRLWDRLSSVAKERTRISALFVAGSGEVEEVQ
jgi:hypothetical protein